MPQLPIADKTTLDIVKINVDTANTNINSVNTKTGTNTDASGETTLFARLKQIYDYLTTMASTALSTSTWTSTRAAKLDLVGIANPTTSDKTTIMNYLRLLESNSVIQPTKPRNAEFSAATITANTWYTVLDITSGQGILSRLSGYTNMNGNHNFDFEITIDGVIQNTTKPTYSSCSRGIAALTSSITADMSQHYFFNAYFKSNLRIRMRHSTAMSTSISASVDYTLV